VVLLTCGAISNVQALAEPIQDAVESNVSRLQLARSIRAFAAGTLTNGTCLIEQGDLNRRQVDTAMNVALRGLRIHPAVPRIPQVRKASELLKPQLDIDWGLSELDASTTRQLIQDEL